eukprot:4398945-Prymnesium_polylepis.1
MARVSFIKLRLPLPHATTSHEQHELHIGNPSSRQKIPGRDTSCERSKFELIPDTTHVVGAGRATASPNALSSMRGSRHKSGRDPNLT